MDIDKVRALTDQELGAELSTQRRHLYDLRFQLATRQLTDHSQLTQARRTVARVLTVMTERGLDASFFDEDWGWQAHAKRPDESVLEISIYHNPDGKQATEDDWALMLRSLHTERKLGISRLREIEVDADAVSTLEDVFREAGVALRRTPPH